MVSHYQLDFNMLLNFLSLAEYMAILSALTMVNLCHRAKANLRKRG